MINKPLHPGSIVKEICVTATGLTVGEVAAKLDVDRTTFSRLINEHAGISSEMAIRLSKALDTSPEMWMNLQRDYDLYLAKKVKIHVEKITEAA